MKIKGNLYQLILIVAMAQFSTAGPVQGAEPDRKDCSKPKFRAFEPPHMSEVLPGSEITFHAWKVDEKSSIKVTAKKIPLELEITDKNVYYDVKARLPESLKDTYARISIKGGSEIGCKSQDGWLLKITGDEQTAGSKTEQPQEEPAEVISPVQAVKTDENANELKPTQTEPVEAQ